MLDKTIAMSTAFKKVVMLCSIISSFFDILLEYHIEDTLTINYLLVTHKEFFYDCMEVKYFF